ncbi:hypothetical protein KIW84_034916 [Lathyrus oleraceus]|uniref:Reverse transcriptase RNase H-like domain-containing protein n=1 Tax=Pisum sativum TaxID=3888 RepID=A0A9D4XZW0_PEA|nr:hypothetical protein KIW84_034916 [Pisum sativum]
MQLQSAYTREFYATTTTLAKFRHYLLGHKFILRTDQKSLKSLLDQSLQIPEQQAWLHKFIGFDFRIEYKPGKDNQAADALSRMMSLSLSAPECEFLEELKQEIAEDEHLQLIVQQCLDNHVINDNYSVKDGLLYWKHILSYPNFNLEDKIALEGEGNVMSETSPIDTSEVNEEWNDDVAKEKAMRCSKRSKGEQPMWTFVRN